VATLAARPTASLGASCSADSAARRTAALGPSRGPGPVASLAGGSIGIGSMTIWLTSDWHLFHVNILDYCARPFRNVQHMQETIVANYQQRVAEDDVVWFLGDLTMQGSRQIQGVQKIISRLPGQKHFILGNHDRFKVQSYLRMGFLSFHTSIDLQYRGQQYHLVHDPKNAPPGTHRLICGHVHEKWKTRQQPYVTVNVGVDVWEFAPVQMTDVVTIFIDNRNTEATA